MKKLIFIFCLLTIPIVQSQDQQDNSPEVEGWFFKATSGYPASITFKPLVLFKDGSYYEVQEKPIKEIRISTSKSNQPELWGTWKKSGSKYTLVNNEDTSRVYDLNKGNWFPAFPFNKSINLMGTYEKISGGDFGNGTYAMFQSQLTFIDDTHFTHTKNSGIHSFNSNTWKNSLDSGSYTIDKNTIVFKYNNGSELRLSFAIGAKGKNELDLDMIFVGGKAYVIE